MSPSHQTFITFAYGSNMLTRNLRGRCPSATPLGMAALNGHELRWHKRSRMDESGKCDAFENGKESSVVFGVLFRIAVTEKPALDRAEGLGRGYEEKIVTVTSSGESHSASMYFATDIESSIRPYAWYKAMVVAGGQEHGLPSAYVAQLKLVEAKDDPDPARHAEKMAIVTGSSGGAR